MAKVKKQKNAKMQKRGNKKVVKAVKRPGKPVKAKAAKARKGAAQRPSSWLDPRTQTPVIDKMARQLRSFIETMADGVVDNAEIAAQEKRLIALMKRIEPKLDDSLHAEVTQLLCEVTAYDLMRVLHSMCAGRPRTAFQG